MKKIFIGILLGALLAGLFLKFNSRKNLFDEKELLSKYTGGYETRTIIV